MRPTAIHRLLPALAALLLAGTEAHAAFAEPPVIFYGNVLHRTGLGALRQISAGTLTLEITPPRGGAPIVITTPLAVLPGQTNYRVEIPVERLTGETATPAGAIPARSRRVAGSSPTGSAASG